MICNHPDEFAQAQLGIKHTGGFEAEFLAVSGAFSPGAKLDTLRGYVLKDQAGRKGYVDYALLPERAEAYGGSWLVKHEDRRVTWTQLSVHGPFSALHRYTGLAAMRAHMQTSAV